MVVGLLLHSSRLAWTGTDQTNHRSSGATRREAWRYRDRSVSRRSKLPPAIALWDTYRRSYRQDFTRLAELEHVGMSCAANCASSLVSLWHKADLLIALTNVRIKGASGHSGSRTFQDI